MEEPPACSRSHATPRDQRFCAPPGPLGDRRSARSTSLRSERRGSRDARWSLLRRRHLGLVRLRREAAAAATAWRRGVMIELPLRLRRAAAPRERRQPEPAGRVLRCCGGLTRRFGADARRRAAPDDAAGAAEHRSIRAGECEARGVSFGARSSSTCSADDAPSVLRRAGGRLESNRIAPAVDAVVLGRRAAPPRRRWRRAQADLRTPPTRQEAWACLEAQAKPDTGSVRRLGARKPAALCALRGPAIGAARPPVLHLGGAPARRR